jgi:hypothetical protein
MDEKDEDMSERAIGPHIPIKLDRYKTVLKPVSLIIRTRFEKRAYDRARPDGHNKHTGVSVYLLFTRRNLGSKGLGN